jgi:hypothetical protein
LKFEFLVGPKRNAAEDLEKKSTKSVTLEPLVWVLPIRVIIPDYPSDLLHPMQYLSAPTQKEI